MASQKETQKAFLEAVSKGSVDEVKAILQKNGKDATTQLAQTPNGQGETPLLLAIREDHEKMVAFLVNKLKVNIYQLGKFSWNGEDYSEVPPLFAAVVSAKNFCLPIVDTLIHAEDKDMDFDNLNFDNNDDDEEEEIMADYIVASSLTRQQKIDVLELIGAAYITKVSIVRLFAALQCWKQAILLREPTDDGEPGIPKIQYPLSECARKIFGDISEFETLEQLQEKTVQRRYDWIHNQAHLITMRIMNRIHPDPNCFSLFVLYYLGTLSFHTMSKHIQAINALMLVLEPYQMAVEEASYEWPYELIADTVIIISESFQKLKKLPPNSPQRKDLTFTNIMKALYYFSPYTKQSVDAHLTTKVDATVPGIFNLTSLIVEMQPEMKREEKEEFNKWLSDYIAFINGQPGIRSLLHYMCAYTKVKLDIIQMLIEAGTNPNAADPKGDTPLHNLANNKNPDNITEAVQLLLNAGCLLGQANTDGQTVEDLQLSPNLKSFFEDYRTNVAKNIKSL